MWLLFVCQGWEEEQDSGFGWLVLLFGLGFSFGFWLGFSGSLWSFCLLVWVVGFLFVCFKKKIHNSFLTSKKHFNCWVS